LGLSAGPVPARVDAVVKAGLLDLIDHAVEQGWTRRRVCRLLGLDEDRAHRWAGRRAENRLDDATPGGAPMHGILPAERDAILQLFEACAGIDKSHRKLAHRGSRLDFGARQRVHGAAGAESRKPCPARETRPGAGSEGAVA
jgi:putative transposase